MATCAYEGSRPSVPLVSESLSWSDKRLRPAGSKNRTARPLGYVPSIAGSECPTREPHSQLIRVKVFLHEPGRCRTESSASSTKIDVAIFLFGQEISRRLQYDVGDASSSYARKSSDRSLQSTATSSITSRGATDVSISSSGAGGRKRRKATDDQDGESEDDGSRNYRRRSKTPSSTPSEPLKLACPFFKHSPAQFRMTHSCTGPFSTVHRVKEHVYRRHRNIYCSRCHKTFATELDRREHLVATEICSIRKNPTWDVNIDGLSEAQETQLRSRKGLASKNQEEKWKHMYSIIFPDEPESSIPSPYLSMDDLKEPTSDRTDGLFTHLQRELPGCVQEHFTEKMREILQKDPNAKVPDPTFERIQNHVADIVRQSLDSLCQTYRTTERASGRVDDPVLPPQFSADEEPSYRIPISAQLPYQSSINGDVATRYQDSATLKDSSALLVPEPRTLGLENPQTYSICWPDISYEQQILDPDGWPKTPNEMPDFPDIDYLNILNTIAQEAD